MVFISTYHLWVPDLHFMIKLTQVIDGLILTQAMTILLLIYILLIFKIQVSLCHLTLRAPSYTARYHVMQTHGGMPWEGGNKCYHMIIG